MNFLLKPKWYEPSAIREHLNAICDYRATEIIIFGLEQTFTIREEDSSHSSMMQDRQRSYKLYIFCYTKPNQKIIVKIDLKII